MTDQDTDEQTADDSQADGQGGQVEESASGQVVEGYETNNAPKEQTQALLEADSPDDVDDDLIKSIEEERDRRLDPENRPDNVEVDNTKRVFVPAEAKFEDSDIDQDPSLGQEGLAPVGGDAGQGGEVSSDDSGDSGDSGDSDDSGPSDDSEHVEPDVESGDPKDESTTKTSGTPDPTDSDQGGDTGSAGRHKA